MEYKKCLLSGTLNLLMFLVFLYANSWYESVSCGKIIAAVKEGNTEVNFTNIVWAVFENLLITLLCEKAARKMLIKLTPGVDPTKLSFFRFSTFGC